MDQPGLISSPGLKKSTKVHTERRYLEASLKIQTDGSCPVSAFDDDITVIDIVPGADQCVTEFLTDDITESCEKIRRQGGECACGDSADDCDDVVFRASISRQEKCICDIFKQYGCIPRIKGRETGHLLIDTYLPDRETLSSLIRDLKQRSTNVQVTRIQEVNPTTDSERQVPIDLGTLTTMQRKCLNLALEKGYFDDPRGISQADLAAELGISPSAVSRRLRSIEKRLFEQLESDIAFD